MEGLGLELEHLSLPERKFEHLDSVEHSCLYQCHHQLLSSTPFPSYSPQCRLDLHQECCQDRVLVSRLMANFDKNFRFILIIVAFSINLLYSSSHQCDF